jgi:hypothetical protein
MSARSRVPVIPLIIFLLLAVASTAPIVIHPGSIAFWPNALYSDLILTHLPNARIAHYSLFSWHQAPLWNPVILSGTPFAADPLAGITYPPYWLAVLFPTTLTFNLLFILHLVWAGLGAYQLSRAEGVGIGPALAAGIVFAASTKFATHISLGHIGLVSAVSWTPWVLLAWRRVYESSIRNWGGKAALAGGVLGITFLADPRWLIPCALLTIAYSLHQILAGERRSSFFELAKRASVILIFALGLAASLLLPLVELTRLSTRAVLASSEPEIFSLRPVDLLGSIVLRSGEPEQFVYLGVAALLLAIIGMLRMKSKGRFWTGAALLSLLLALGSSTPIYGWVRSIIPGADLLRVPARYLFLAVFALAQLSAEGLEVLSSMVAAARTQKRLQLAGFAFCIMVLVLNGGLLAIRGLEAMIALVPLLAALAGLVLLMAGAKIFRSGRSLQIAWLVLVAGELIWIDSALLDPRPLTDPQPGSSIATLIASEHGRTRIFSPTFSIDELQAATLGWEQAEGVSPLQLRSYQTYLAAALGLVADDYSVTLPPFNGSEPSLGAGNNVVLSQLEKLNIGWIVTSSPWDAAGLEPAGEQNGLLLYQLPEPRSRAWLEPEAGMTGADWKAVELDTWSPNLIRLMANGPGKLVLSEIYYPGWVVRVDGARADMQLEDGLLRGVDLAAGAHEVEFVFHPWTVFVGWGISLVSWIALIYLQRRR